MADGNIDEETTKTIDSLFKLFFEGKRPRKLIEIGQEGGAAGNLVVDRFISVLETDELWSDCEGAAFALGEIKNPKALHPLLKAAGHKDRSVRAIAISGIVGFVKSGLVIGRNDRKEVIALFKELSATYPEESDGYKISERVLGLMRRNHDVGLLRYVFYNIRNSHPVKNIRDRFAGKRAALLTATK